MRGRRTRRESLIYEKYVLPVINSAVPYCIFNPQTKWQDDILKTLLQIYSLQENEKNNELLTLQMMMQYIHDHYREQITLEEIAGAASVSKSSALNIFQSGIHTSPISYTIQHRLKCACRLLYATEKSVSAIAEETGFSNAGYFCRKFRECYHMSPTEYKSKRLI